MVAGGRELIDTLWNVNNFALCFLIDFQTELIDTLWNVNIGDEMKILLAEQN